MIKLHTENIILKVITVKFLKMKYLRYVYASEAVKIVYTCGPGIISESDEHDMFPWHVMTRSLGSSLTQRHPAVSIGLKGDWSPHNHRAV